MTSSQTNQLTISSPREEWIDYLRGLGIIFMLIGHTRITPIITNWIYGFHMPLFFILSGYLFNRQKWSQIGFRQFIRARFKNFIIPYFIWCAICFLINLPMIYHGYHDQDLALALIQNIGWIITSVRVDEVFLPQNCTPLWFLTCLFLCQLVFFWLVKCRPVWQCALSAVFIAINYVLNFFEAIILPWHLEVALIGSVFMLAGYYIRELKLIDRVRSITVPILMVLISSAIILLNDSVDIYYRRYGSSLIVFMLAAALMCYALMWICRSMKTLYFKGIVLRMGIYSIIPMGLNYSINRYARLVCRFIRRRTEWDLDWVEYPLSIIGIVICLIAIALYLKLVSHDRRFRVLIGRL